MLSPPGDLAAAQLAVYIIIFFLATYTFFLHGKNGLIGWFFIIAFCVLRIIGSGLTITDEKKHTVSETTQIISGVGLSPLLLSVSGILTEVNHYVAGKRSWVMRWPAEVAMHILVVTGLALVIVGIQNGGTLAKVGYIVFEVVWIVLIGLTALSWRPRQRGSDSRKLLMGVTLSLPFLGVRVLYSLISQYDTGINAYTGSIAYRVVLSVLMEFFVVIILVGFGVITRGIHFEEPSLENTVSAVEVKTGDRTGNV